MTIVVISNSESFINAASAFSDRQPFEFEAANSGTAGLDLVSELRPENVALIIIDKDALKDITIQEFYDISILKFNVNTPQIELCAAVNGELQMTKTGEKLELKNLTDA